MSTKNETFAALLNAARRLLDAREAQMVTSEEWDALHKAVTQVERRLQQRDQTEERSRTMRVNTNEYVGSHCKAPRGRGVWYFTLVYPDGRTEEYQTSGNTPYAVGKADACRLAISRGAVEVRVGP
jgi:hypothetical protein